jgi:hypothetical protein
VDLPLLGFLIFLGWLLQDALLGGSGSKPPDDEG